MDIEWIRIYCLQKQAVTECLPFDENTLVFKVMDKMFLLLDLNGNTFNTKCNPEYAIELRDTYEAITPGYHMNKKYWNTIVYSELPNNIVLALIDHSYNEVVAGFTKKQKLALNHH